MTWTPSSHMAINHQSIVNRVLNQPPPNRGRSVHPSIIHPAAGWLAFDQHAARRPCAPGTAGRSPSPSLTGNPPSGAFQCLARSSTRRPGAEEAGARGGGADRIDWSEPRVRRCSCHAATQPRARGLPTKATAFLRRRAACHRNSASLQPPVEYWYLSDSAPVNFTVTYVRATPDTVKCFYFLTAIGT